MSRYQFPSSSGGGGGGTVWYTGAGAPSTIHNDGDLYLNTSNGDVYQQASGSWGSPIANLTGPAGADAVVGVVTKTADYNVLSTDTGTLVVLTTGSHTFTLPGTVPSNGWHVWIVNIGSGTLTIARNGHNIDGAAANLTLTQFQGLMLATDGTNYYSDGHPSSGGGSSTLAGLSDVSITTPANNDVLTYETSSTLWKNKPASGGGGGVPAGTHISIFADLTGASANPGVDTTLTIKIPFQLILAQAGQFKVALQANSFAADYDNVVIKRTLPGSLTVVDSTQVTFGGMNAFTVPTHTLLYSDAIALSIDTQHDYYIMAHISATSAHGLVGTTSAPIIPFTNQPYYADSGDITSQTTIAVTSSGGACFLYGDFQTA